MSEREIDFHGIVFCLTYLAEGQKLDFINIGIFGNDFFERKYIFFAIIDRRNDNLTDGNGNIFLLQVFKKCQRRLQVTADIFKVLLIICILDIQKHEICFFQQGFDGIIQNTSRGIKTGVNAVLTISLRCSKNLYHGLLLCCYYLSVEKCL